MRTALAALDVSPEDAWVVGDGPQDVFAGRGAGAWTVGILGGFATEDSLRDAKPDLLLPSLHAFAQRVRDGAATGTA